MIRSRAGNERSEVLSLAQARSSSLFLAEGLVTIATKKSIHGDFIVSHSVVAVGRDENNQRMFFST